MNHRQSFHAYVGVLIDHPRFDLVHIHAVATVVDGLRPGQTRFDVFSIGSEKMFRHRPGADGTVHFQRLVPLQDPWGENEIWIARGVV